MTGYILQDDWGKSDNTMKTRIISAIVVILILAGLTAVYCLKLSPRLNLLLITLDTTRADHLGCYGYPVAITPALDALAQAGTLFEEAYTCVPITLPSHATMMTGLYPPEHGIRVNGKNSLPTNVTTLAEILLKRGYKTGAFTASSILSSCYGLNKGFLVYDDVNELGENIKAQLHRSLIDNDEQNMPYRAGNIMAASAIKWLRETLNVKKNPFFCWVHFYDPHFPGHWHEDTFPTNTFNNMYDAEIGFMDIQVGKLLKFLDENNLRKNTLIIAVGDHGEGLDDHGENMHGFMLYPSTLRVPLIISLPGAKPQNRVSSMVSLRDLFPTILDLLKVNPSIYSRTDPRNDLLASCSARSFAPAVTGCKTEPRPCYAETDMPYISFQWSPLRCVITPLWKYIRAPRAELYDHVADPGDWTDIASRLPGRLDEMESLLSDIESKMIQGSASAVSLSPEQMRQLASLGYAAGGSTSAESPGVRKDMPDVKDMTACLNMQLDIGIAMRRGVRDEKVLAACREAIRLSPKTAKFYTWEGMILSAQKKLEESLRSFDRAREMAPDEFTTYNNLATVLIEQGKAKDAIPYFEKALQLNPINESVKHNLAIACNQYGQELGSTGNLEESVTYLLKAVATYPAMAPAHHNLGVAYLNLGQLTEAIAEFEEALKLDPEYALTKRALEVARGKLAPILHENQQGY